MNSAARALLDAADRQLARHQLSSPYGDNAIATYARVLEVDPGMAAQGEVRRGRERIIEAYLGLAAEQLDAGANAAQLAAARSYIDRAATIDPAHPSVTAMRQRFAVVGAAPQQRIALDPAALQARQPPLVLQLRKIGTDAKTRKAFVTIFARSDAEGRWIYRQLSTAPGEVRVRADIRLSRVPALQLMYLAGPCNAC